ncbi:uncharacterized protein PAC_15866 [Phialocephala subalpina]|uniref:Thioredoxin domain-containing protein n=1 Tax=Phialocephala subalpina TaxID=576137 RepID=A0A1L7XLY8_9HELO|nr:uncharacterized protein PAC_15866 [Phialocephala subalpina]
MDTQSPVEKYRSLLSSHKFVFLVFFRGHWCPFCIAYLTTLTSLAPSIEASGGKVVIATSEPLNFLSDTRKATGYQGEAIVDPENELAKHLKQKGFLDVAISEKKGYTHGMAQPAILVMNKEGEVFERWAIVPSMMNLGGAKDRPELEQVWENVQAKLEGKKMVHSAYKKIGAVGLLWGKVFG